MENSLARLSGMIMAENQNLFISGEIHMNNLGFMLSGIQENFGIKNKCAPLNAPIACLYCVTELTKMNGNYYYFPINNLEEI